MSFCETCGGLGFYMDRQCLDKTCAHRGRLVAMEQDGKTIKKRRKVMDCPSRACLCPAGKSEREQLQIKVRAQERRIALVEGLLS